MDIIYKGARGSGRTTMLVKAANDFALANPGALMHFYTPMATQLDNVLRMFSEELSKHNSDGKWVKFSKRPRAEIIYANGARIEFFSTGVKTAGPIDQMGRSYLNVDSVFFDDSEHMDRTTLLKLYNDTQHRFLSEEDREATEEYLKSIGRA